MTHAPRITITPIHPDGGSLVSFRRPPTAEQIIGDAIHDVASAITVVLFILAAIALAINIQGGTI